MDINRRRKIANKTQATPYLNRGNFDNYKKEQKKSKILDLKELYQKKKQEALKQSQKQLLKLKTIENIRQRDLRAETVKKTLLRRRKPIIDLRKKVLEQEHSLKITEDSHLAILNYPVNQEVASAQNNFSKKLSDKNNYPPIRKKAKGVNLLKKEKTKFSLGKIVLSIVSFPLVFVRGLARVVGLPVKKLKQNKYKQKTSRLDLILSRKWAYLMFLVICVSIPASIKALDYVNVNLLEKKNIVLDEAGVAYQYISSAQNSIFEKDYDLAAYKFNVAAATFLDAKGEIDQIGEVITEGLKIIPGGSKAASAQNLLSAGGNIALAGEYLAYALEPFSATPNLFDSVNPEKQGSSESEYTLTEAIKIANQNLMVANDRMLDASKDLEGVKDSDLPEEIRDDIKTIKDKLPELLSVVEKFDEYTDYLLVVLGDDIQKRYLVLFENNRELRAGGGFIGSYALVDIDQGQVKKMFVEGPYGWAGQMTEKISAPEPIHLINPHWYMHDANWFLDFPTSAEKVNLLYQKSGAPSADGVIAITATVMQKLLELTGPIEMTEYGLTVTADNFYETTQYEVEFNYDKEENEPKKFITDLTPIVIEKTLALQKDKWPALLNLFLEMTKEKQIMMYFDNYELEKKVVEMGMGGEIKNTTGDYLSVVSSNLGGGKTDHVVKQKIDHQVEIQPDGSLIATVLVTRTHMGSENALWIDVKNMSYLRFYTPLGSQLIEAKGFDGQFFNELLPADPGATTDPTVEEIETKTLIEQTSSTRIGEESGKTVFGNWLGVETGQERKAYVKYRLPFKLTFDQMKQVNNYSLYIQKQPGSFDQKFSSEIYFTENFNPVWHYSSDNLVKRIGNRMGYETTLNGDKVYALVFSEN